MSASAFFDDILIRARRGMGHTRISSAPKTRGERMWNSLGATGSAFVKRIPGAGVQHSKQLAGQLAYVNGKAKAAFGFATGVTPEGEEFEQAELEQLIDAWSRDWRGRPRNGHTSHMVLSFPDDVSHIAALSIAQDWCAEMFESGQHIDDKWEYVAALHTDTENPHVHVIVNNRGIDGNWFFLSSEGVFNPQMMRDRMTDLADDYGVRLESLTRVDRGLYHEPISSEEVHAAREGRTLKPKGISDGQAVNWRAEEIIRTAELYTTLAEFAEVIGAPMFAKRAHLSSAALFAGKSVPKGQLMSIDLDVTADREDVRTTLVGWVEQNREAIDALPDVHQQEIMTKIDAALEIIESDTSFDLTEEMVWEGFGHSPSSYLIRDVGAVEARAAMYIADEDAAVFTEFVNENVLERYLVTGVVADKYKPALEAVADAYGEMHNHDLAEIPKQMKEYVRQAGNAGLDAADFQERLINKITDPVVNTQMERDDIITIAERRTFATYDADAFDDAVKVIDAAAVASVNHGTHSEEDIFENLSIALGRAAASDDAKATHEAWEAVGVELTSLAEQDANGHLSPKQSALLDDLAPAIFDRHGEDIAQANLMRVDDNFGLAELDRETVTPEKSSDELYTEIKAEAVERNDHLKLAMAPYAAGGPKAAVYAYRQAAEVYDVFQDALGEVEVNVRSASTAYSRDGVARVLQDAAHTAATTGRADFGNSDAARTVLKAYVALEGRDAMAELATGNMDPLAEYLDTPASRRLAARELLKSAKQVDVGLEPDQIEDGLEAVDPTYSRGTGYSI